ncbi:MULTISPECIES: WD40 repeat domain-containing protein [unclassified Streptomyces]|uniref:WD40 repeat domain-containing protein n=1 Tax=unclassified Streptomyces TaxID=2593676 RepID=UPI000A8697B6|nr:MULTISPECIES: WD40 repeat domain-containing protein [unclassified Streptomyces]
MTPIGGPPARGSGGPSVRSEEMPRGERVGLQARASDRARIYQARRDLYVSERDLHVHYESGVRGTHRVPDAALSDECPYPGLSAFTTDQARWFFGRDSVVAKLLVRLDGCLAAGGALVVVAPSGAGKSSLLRAGLLAELGRGVLPGSARWPLVWLTPTSHPMEALGAHLWEVMESGRDGSPVLRPDELRRALAKGTGERRVVVVVDQLEELFTLCPDKQERRDFLDAVLGIAEVGPSGEPPPGLVVFGLRSDFYTQCAAHPGLLEAVERNQVMMGPLTRTGVREAILYPARTVGLDVEPGLVEVLLHDLGTTEDGAEDDPAYEIGRLPLLAHALRATWLRRTGHVLTVDGYEATGGIAHSVATEADRWFDRLDPSARETARSLFLRMVKFGERGAADTRCPVRYDDLVSHCARPEEAAQVAEKFTRGRLLTREQDKVTITHEVLLRTWPRLRQWIRDHRARYLARQRLEDAAVAWEEAGRDPGLLYRGVRLEEARALAGGGGAHDDEGAGRLGPVASEFLSASVRHRQRVRRIWHGLVAVLSALAVALAVVGVFARVQSDRARQERNAAIAGEVRAEADQVRMTDASLAAQLDVVAQRMQPTESTVVSLLGDEDTPLSTVLTGHRGEVNTVDFSPDGHVLASGGDKGEIRLWNTAGPDRPSRLGEPLRGFGQPVWGVHFSAVGHFLAAAAEDGTFRRWDVHDPRHPTALGGPVKAGGGGQYALAISPDGRLLATAGDDGRVRLWDVSDPRDPKLLGQPLTGAGPKGSVYGVAFSPDGTLLAAGGSDATVRLWHVTDPRRPRAAGTPTIPDASAGDDVKAVAFTHDNRTLAATGTSGTTQLWDITDPAKPSTIVSPTAEGDVNAVAFSHTGNLMALGGDSNAVGLYNMASPKDVRGLASLVGHTGHVWGLAFNPKGTQLASVGNDHQVRVWTIPRTILTGHSNAVQAMALSRDGHLLASGSVDRTVRLWDVSNTADPRLRSASIRLDAPSSPYAVAFQPGRRVLAVAAGPKVQLWDVTDATRPRLLRSPPGHADHNFLSVAFTPRGDTMASGDSHGAVLLWNVSDPSRPRLLGRPLSSGSGGQINGVAISPDGRTLVAVSDDGRLRLWDVADPARPRPLGRLRTVSEDPVNSVVFSPDSRMLTTSGDDAVLRLWDIRDRTRPRHLGQDLTGHRRTVTALAFSPDGRAVASGGSDQTLRLWDVRDPDHARPFGKPVVLPDYIDTMTFSGDGRTLFIGDGSSAVRILPMTPRSAVAYICRSTGNVLTPQLWHEYVPHLPYDPPCARP